MVAVVLSGSEIVGIYGSWSKAREMYNCLIRAGIWNARLAEWFMHWDYFVSPPVAWERVYAIMLPNGKVYSLHRTMESAQKLVKDVFIDCPEPMIREMIMEW
jgi:hypothetical protein